LNITSLTAKEHEVVEEVSDIPRMLPPSLRLSVEVLTLLSWTMDGNSSTPVMSQQSSPRLGFGYFSWQVVLMN